MVCIFSNLHSWRSEIGGFLVFPKNHRASGIGVCANMIKLNDSNWILWKTTMQDLLYCDDLYLPLEGVGAKPETMTMDEWNKLDRKAASFILRWLDDCIFVQVLTESSASSLWKKLEDIQERNRARNKLVLFRKLFNLKYRDGSPMVEHLIAMRSIFGQLSCMGTSLDDEAQALLVLGSLPDSWETLVFVLCSTAPDGVVTMKRVWDSLLNGELMKKIRGTNDEALAAKGGGRGESRDRRRQSRSRSKSRSRKNVVCWNCGEKGHFKNQCGRVL